MLWSTPRLSMWNWNPWREMRRLQDEMNRLFEGYAPRARRVEFPPLNMRANQETILVTCELPGVEAENINVSVQDDMLTLSCERPREELAEGERLHREERPHGQFTRSISLPYRVSGDDVDASYHNGVLCVRLSRVAEDKPKQIEVKTA